MFFSEQSESNFFINKFTSVFIFHFASIHVKSRVNSLS